MRLFMIRHGESQANIDRIYAGHVDTPLTARGCEQARSIRPVLAKIPFDRVFSSDLKRAWDTQKNALPDVKCTATDLLREFDVGSLAGESFLWHKDKIAMDRDYTPYGGESVDMVCRRLDRFLEQLERNPCENVAAFTHHGVVICMLRKILGNAFDSSLLHSFNCSIHVFEFTDGKWRLLAFNYMNPLF
ncbi:MAG: histidine phosphatase family protein [Oscillospiraceae bacterium]|nr:histidine phosphatase family protein [Oscillospiraceae bacterium]